MKRMKISRSLIALLLAAVMVLPLMPSVHASEENKCGECGMICTQIVLKQANCHEQGVVEDICVNSKCRLYKESVLKKTDIDPKNHDTICVDNGDGKTHTAVCRYHSEYRKVDEPHVFVNGYCSKCAAADYTKAEIVMPDKVELLADLDAADAVLSIGTVAVVAGNVDVSRHFEITYLWIDGNGSFVGTGKEFLLPASVTAQVGTYSYSCFVTAKPIDIEGRNLNATCEVTVEVRDIITVTAVVSSGSGAFSLDDTNAATTVSVLEQIEDAVNRSSREYADYVIFDKKPTSELGKLNVNAGKYYFTAKNAKQALEDVVFTPADNVAGSYVINFTAYDTEGKTFPGVLTIVVERDLGALDVSYFAHQGEEIAFSGADFAAYWQELCPGGMLKEVHLKNMPTSKQGTLYYNYNANSSNNTVITEKDALYTVLSNANQYLVDGVTFVPASKFVGRLTIPFEMGGLSTDGYYLQKTGTLSIFVSSKDVEDLAIEMNNGKEYQLDGDELLAIFRDAVGNKSENFSIKLLDVPHNGELYLNYTGTIRDVALTADEIADYTFSYSSALGLEIGDLTYVSEKSNKTLTDTLRYIACDEKGEFAYIGHIVFTCKPLEVVYTHSFPDVKKTDWFYTYVMDLAEEGVINGIEEIVDEITVVRYKPGDNVTYAQALKLILLATGYAEQAPTGKHWASGYLDKAKEDKLIGNVMTEERLDDPITRNMIAYIAARAMKLPKSEKTESPLKDVLPDSTHAPYIFALYDAEIIKGDENGMFNGGNKISRAEMATIVWRIKNYEG